MRKGRTPKDLDRQRETELQTEFEKDAVEEPPDFPSISFLPALAPRYEYENKGNGQNRSSNFFKEDTKMHLSLKQLA